MATRGLALFLIALAQLACVTTEHVQRPDTVDAFQHFEAAGPVTVEYAPAPERPSPPPHAAGDKGRRRADAGAEDGAWRADLVGLDAVDLQLRGLWIEDPKKPTYLGLGDVRAVQLRNHERGAFEGLTLGLLTGATAGALIGFAMGNDPPCDDSMFGACFQVSARTKAIVGGAAGGVSGAILGVVLGALIGHVDRYVF